MAEILPGGLASPNILSGDILVPIPGSTVYSCVLLGVDLLKTGQYSCSVRGCGADIAAQTMYDPDTAQVEVHIQNRTDCPLAAKGLLRAVTDSQRPRLNPSAYMPGTHRPTFFPPSSGGKFCLFKEMQTVHGGTKALPFGIGTAACTRCEDVCTKRQDGMVTTRQPVRNCPDQ